MKTVIKFKETGWSDTITREYSGSVTITEITETLLNEGLISKEDSGVYVIKNGETDQELASYYPVMNKVIRLSEASALKDIFSSSGSAALFIDKTETMQERLEQISPFVKEKTPAPETPSAARSDSRWWKAAPAPAPAVKEDENTEISPYEKEKSLCELCISVTGEDQPAPAGAAAQLWLYLLGFVLVAAFLVRSLVCIMKYDGSASSDLWNQVLSYMLLFLLPSVLCFAAGKAAEILGKKKSEKKAEHTGK